MSKIWLCLAHMGGKEQEFVQQAFDTNWVVPLGPNVDGFEKDLEGWHGRRADHPIHVVALASGTSAIHLGLVMLGVGPGDEVICQSFTFSASANPVKYLGASPVFVDSEAATWNMDPVLLEQAIKDRIQKTGRKPKAIITVYLYGNPGKISQIMEIANRYEIPVLEDAAEALGSEYDGQSVGTFGAYGVMSFNGNKMITTSGGGALICPSEEAAKRVKFYATQAREPFPYYQHEKIGYNYRLSNVCAGIGRGQMYVLDEHIAHHRHIHERYASELKVEGITVFTPKPDKPANPNYWLNTILVDPEITGYTYMDLLNHLAQADIESRPLWKPMHLQPVYKDAPAYVNGTAEKLFQKGLCLPSGPMVSDRDVDYIIQTIASFKK